jgi:hypothetical protein
MAIFYREGRRGRRLEYKLFFTTEARRARRRNGWRLTTQGKNERLKTEGGGREKTAHGARGKNERLKTEG